MPTAIRPKKTMMTANSDGWVVPDWPLPPNVRCLVTTRAGGVSQGAFASLNLANHVGDDPVAVAANRARLCQAIGASPIWLNQVHGTRVIDATLFAGSAEPPEADAAFSSKKGVACIVMTADCLPVLFCDETGTVVAAAHAGWRGLLAGVLEETIMAMGVPGKTLTAYFGPAIGPAAFEVGDDVRSAFVDHDRHASTAFKPSSPNKWLANIYALAEQRLKKHGLVRVFGGARCTVNEPEHFFSYRRDQQTGRMASMIWLDR